jgi:epidermal growth factor receptor substrate 15
MPGHFTQEAPTETPHTDLDSQLKELDVEESDSDSDEDEVPLAEIKAKAVEQTRSSEANGDAAKTTDFDDIFGATAAPVATSNDIFGGATDNETKAFDSSDADASGQAAGVNAFDEAMGKITNSAGPTSSPFTFESAFEDTFDFGSSPPVNTAAPPPATNGHAATSPAPAQDKPSDGFDSIFNTEPVNTTNGEAKPSVPASQPAPATLSTSFDEAFASFDSGPSLSLDASNAPSTAKVPESPKPFPTTASATSSPRSNRPNSPPPRTKTPPPRVGSPKSTKSTSKDGHEKQKEVPPARHSKLSVSSNHSFYFLSLDVA